MSEYYAFLCMSYLPYVANNFYKHCFIRVYSWKIVYQYILSYDDCCIRVYRSLTTIFPIENEYNIHSLIQPVMLALRLILSMTYYAQNYAGIIGGSLEMENMSETV